MRRTRSGQPPDRAYGFTLIEIAVVIVVLSLLLAMIAGIATAMVGQQRREATRQRLAGVETALALFVSQHKRLPCPAFGNLALSDVNLGLEARSAGACQGNQQHGVVPWRTLGLAEPDVTDGWGNRLTFRVEPSLVADQAMDMTNCDSGGTFDLSGTPIGRCNQTGTSPTDCNKDSFPARCTPPSAYTLGKGILIKNNAAVQLTVMDPCAPISTGAAYVVISHGENGEKAYSTQSTIQAASATGSGTNELSNAADLAFTPPSPRCSGPEPFFVDDFPSYAAGTDHYDDFVLRPSILTVATKAQLGPRAH